MLQYNGYSGHVDFDSEAGLFHGEVVDTRDVITFQGTSVSELEQAFRDSIDDYLDFCSASTSSSTTDELRRLLWRRVSARGGGNGRLQAWSTGGASGHGISSMISTETSWQHTE